jgi:hypothetical protein
MKKYIYSVLAPLALLGTKVSLAQTTAEQLAEGSPIKEPKDIFRILSKVVSYAYTVFFIVAVLFILIAAFNFLTAKGDSAKVQSARSQITWAVVAIAIALISVGAAQIIKSFITP